MPLIIDDELPRRLLIHYWCYAATFLSLTLRHYVIPAFIEHFQSHRHTLAVTLILPLPAAALFIRDLWYHTLRFDVSYAIVNIADYARALHWHAAAITGQSSPADITMPFSAAFYFADVAAITLLMLPYILMPLRHTLWCHWYEYIADIYWYAAFDYFRHAMPHARCWYYARLFSASLIFAIEPRYIAIIYCHCHIIHVTLFIIAYYFWLYCHYQAATPYTDEPLRATHYATARAYYGAAVLRLPDIAITPWRHMIRHFAMMLIWGAMPLSRHIRFRRRCRFRQPSFLLRYELDNIDNTRHTLSLIPLRHADAIYYDYADTPRHWLFLARCQMPPPFIFRWPLLPPYAIIDFHWLPMTLFRDTTSHSAILQTRPLHAAAIDIDTLSYHIVAIAMPPLLLCRHAIR